MSNISLSDPNFVYVDNYFYTIDNSLQLLLKKTFDGEIAFCYTLDIPVASQVVSLDYDGVHFWSLERGAARVIIRKWKIVDLICMQYAKFEIISTSSEIINGYAFAVEHYTTKLVSNEGVGQTILSIKDGTKLKNDLHIVIGPNFLGQMEDRVIDSYTSTSVTIKTPLSYAYNVDDLVRFCRSGYYFNNFDGTDSSKGSLYEIDLESGSVITRNAGTQFQNVRAAVFGQVKSRDGNGTYDFNDDGNINADDIVSCLMFIKGTLMLFCDINSTTKVIYGSMVMDLLSGSSSETVYDLTLGRDISNSSKPGSNGSTIYMLKNGYNYQVAQFDRMVNSISVNSAPAILPADGVSVSSIRASVLDQYNKPYQNKIVYFELNGPGALSVDNNTTDQYGVADISYIAGSTVGDATITATVHQS